MAGNLPIHFELSTVLPPMWIACSWCKIQYRSLLYIVSRLDECDDLVPLHSAAGELIELDIGASRHIAS